MMQIYDVRMRFCAERESAKEQTPLSGGAGDLNFSPSLVLSFSLSLLLRLTLARFMKRQKMSSCAPTLPALLTMPTNGVSPRREEVATTVLASASNGPRECERDHGSRE